MTHKVNLLLAIHNHQPVGNFPFVLEEAYQKAYLPFIQTLGDYPSIRITLHYSGFLLEWLVQNHPDFITQIQGMVDGGRVEIMSGGFYEPIFTTLYDSDKIGQIRKLSDFVVKTFGSQPRGIWLAERVWEPHLAETLCNAGAEYIVIDDHHFIMAGLRGTALNGYYITEEKGRLVKVFPGSERLRYLIPFQPVEATLEYLRALGQSTEAPLAIMGDDGEKFGVWPGTHRSVYEEGWLGNFFDALQQNGDWLETRLFSEVIDEIPPLGRIYLPTSSYMEMGEWSLIYDASEEFRQLKEKLKEAGLDGMARPFLSGGFWRNFFSKYPESNLMHKKMLYISEKIHHLPEGRARDEALEELWKGQCNDAYWHGVFGGLYLPHLRSSVHEHLIRAETLADHVLHGDRDSWCQAFSHDIDKDGINEEILNSDSLSLVVDPHCGGVLAALDFRERSFNLLDTFTRVPEFYHKDLLEAPPQEREDGQVKSIHDRVVCKEEGLADKIAYDPYRRQSLIDHFLDVGESLKAFSSGNYRERGDFVQNPYASRRSASETEAAISMERTGSVDDGSCLHPVRVHKTLGLRAGQSVLTADYHIQNLADTELVSLFGVEFNITLLAGNAHDRYYVINGEKPASPNLGSSGETDPVESLELVDEWKGILVRFSLSRPCLLWRFPIETVSLSEGGFEKIYQGSCLLPLWEVRLAPRAHLELTIALELSAIPDHRERAGGVGKARTVTE